MISLRPLSYAALALAYLQIVFGAIVRITGSGMGCGDHWPTCQGQWFPPLDRVDLVIDIAHRYLAAALVLAVVALLVTAVRRRRQAGVAGRGGVLPAASLAGALVVAAALLGAVTVKLGLHPLVVVGHLALAMSLLATLVVATVRAGGLGAEHLAAGAGSMKSLHGARVAAALAFAVLIMGALTANLPGAAAACQGFPLCNGSLMPRGGAQHVQLTHRVLAFLLFFHVLGLTVAIARRREPSALVHASRIVFGAMVAQILIAAALVELGLPAALRSLHQAAGTLVWIAIVALLALARRATVAPAAPETAGLGHPPSPPHSDAARRAASYSAATVDARGAES